MAKETIGYRLLVKDKRMKKKDVRRNTIVLKKVDRFYII